MVVVSVLVVVVVTVPKRGWEVALTHWRHYRVCGRKIKPLKIQTLENEKTTVNLCIEKWPTHLFGFFKSFPLHQTRSHYVLKKLAEEAQTLCKF